MGPRKRKNIPQSPQHSILPPFCLPFLHRKHHSFPPPIYPSISLDYCRPPRAFPNPSTAAQIKASRDALKTAHHNHATTLPKETYSPWRDTSVEENLAKFEKMRTGQYDEGEASLRMKVAPNPKALIQYSSFPLLLFPPPHSPLSPFSLLPSSYCCYYYHTS
jgi:hypothetical protein